MQALYALETSGSEPEFIMETVIRDRLGEDKEAFDFASHLFLRAIRLQEEADEIVVRYTRNWEFSRIALVDRILLRLGITEMLAFEDVPPKVTINEMIEIAKGFSTRKSGQFINGILDSVLTDFQKEGRISKRGRGLIGMESLTAGE